MSFLSKASARTTILAVTVAAAGAATVIVPALTPAQSQEPATSPEAAPKAGAGVRKAARPAAARSTVKKPDASKLPVDADAGPPGKDVAQDEKAKSGSGAGEAPAADAASKAPATVHAPVQHANSAKIQRCGPLIEAASRRSIKTTHTALSSWSPKQPDDHMFQSIIGSTFSNSVAPKAATVLVAARQCRGGEGTLVDIHPTSRSCEDIEGDLRRSGQNPVKLGTLPMTQQGTDRQLLLPVPGSGCVVVGVSLALNQ